jgi:hypothetical protein
MFAKMDPDFLAWGKKNTNRGFAADQTAIKKVNITTTLKNTPHLKGSKECGTI